MRIRVVLLVALGVAIGSALATAAQTPPSDVARGRPDLSGNWIRMRGGPGSSGPREFTDAGKRKFESYDFKKDDPAYGCIASSWNRIWQNLDTVVRITQATDIVRLQYEWMDIDRRLPLGDAAAGNPKRTSIRRMPTLGSSTAWYDGDTLVIDTIDYAPGYISTVSPAGAPQSRRMHTIERLRRSGDALTIEITHVDPAYYRQPFVVMIEYQKSDFELMEYGCTPEDASIVSPR